MRKLYLIVLFLIIASSGSIAQPYNNEWIPFAGQPYSSQQYLRISVWKEGIYRVSYTDIQDAGINMSNWFSPDKYQVFNNGVEQFIRVTDAGTIGVFEPGDYLEFYGKGADGTLDTKLYDDPASQPDPYFNLFNDTASYYLTYTPFSTGRRMPVETDINFNGYTASQYFISENIHSFKVSYNIGDRDHFKIADNSYTRGEGYYSIESSANVAMQVTFTINEFNNLGPAPYADVTVMGANANSHPFHVRAGGTTMLDSTVEGYTMVRPRIYPGNIPSSGNYVVELVPQNDLIFPGNPNYMQMGMTKLRYSRNYNFSNDVFPLGMYVQGTGAKELVEFQNLNLSSPVLYLFSGDTIKIINTDNSSGVRKALIPVYGSEKKLYLTDASQAMTIQGNARIAPVSTDPFRYARFINYLDAGANAEFLIVSNKAIWTGAQNYAAYRQMKGKVTLLADVDELYDQFAWGIKKHPLSIRNFADYMLDNSGVPPKYLFLLGKSIISHNARSGTGYDMNLVPTYGEPASDMMFTAKLNTAEFKPELATGRLAAQNEADVTAYFDKVTAFEAAQKQLPPPLWMKNVLHFGGGTDIYEQQILSTKLGTYKTIIEDTLFGGHVETFLKSSTDPIQINQSEYLQNKIDSGCTMMTFYGHAAGSSFDISTDDPENYNNKDRYPVVLAQSCFVGDIHSTTRLLNERFILTPEKGAVGFIAVPDKGVIEPLDDYSIALHNNLFRDNYGQGVGEAMKATVSEIITTDFDRKSVCMNMTLHGDPALVMNMPELPDYSITNANIFFDPADVTTQIDSFEIKVAVTNLGKNTGESFDLLISRKFPNQVMVKDTTIRIPYVTYRDTFSVKLPVDFNFGSGPNQFTVTVDATDEVDESDDIANNIAHTVLTILSTDINPVYPQEYAIVPSVDITLKATTADLFASPKNYRFEIDTSSFFNSVSKQSTVIQNAAGIVSWDLPSSLNTDVVYYWRVANDSIMNPDTSISKKFQWRNSSFICKPGVTGWSQAHYYQFKQSGLSNMLMTDSIRLYEYIQSQYSILMSHLDNRPSYDINGVNQDYGGCTGSPQIAIAVLDSIDIQNPWTSDSCTNYFGNFNYYNCATGQGCGTRSRADKYFLFQTEVPASMDSLVDMLQNDIPTGNYILAWNVWNINYTNIPNVVNEFVQLGATQMASVQNGQKFMLILKKGSPSSAVMDYDLNPDSTIRITYSLMRDWDKGFISSTKVGPALQWNNLHWNYNSIETSSSPDSISLQVWGITPNGQEVMLQEGITDVTVPFDLSQISAQQYPYLRLRAYTQDIQFLTPPQLSRWQVYYQPVPEGSLNTLYYSFYKDSLMEGDNVKLEMAFENISNVNMDTLLVDYFIYDASNVRRNISSVRLHRDLPAGDTLMTSITFNTQGFAGNNTLWIEANPRNDQPEQYHFNNLASRKFYVSRDITNPLLDVTFDGTHILNGDLVSAKPDIEIRLVDENKFIALNDTGNFRVMLKDPDGSNRIIYFEPGPNINTDPQLLKWEPASLPKNSFKIRFTPNLPMDGFYELTVQAKDEAGNLSGVNDYRIRFEVINKSTITEVVNYPNPFSSSTRFVFVLTGSEVPSQFKIQIMTVTGKIVREITRDEIGPIRIGRNITEYAWDGKDEFGDQLANGVYVYRVQTSIQGSSIEKRETEADKYFKKGWGKMYLLR